MNETEYVIRLARVNGPDCFFERGGYRWGAWVPSFSTLEVASRFETVENAKRFAKLDMPNFCVVVCDDNGKPV